MNVNDVTWPSMFDGHATAECRGGPLDGLSVAVPLHPPGRPPQLQTAYTPRGMDVDPASAIPLGTYHYRAPDDAAPFFEWAGEV